MRQDIEFDAEGTTLRGWLYVPDAGRRAGADDRDVPRLQRGQGAVPGRVRRGVLRGRVLRAGLRQPQPGGLRRRAAAGDRPVGAGARLPARDHLRPHPRRGRPRPDRDLGLELQRRARARGGRDRPAREVRRGPGPAHQRARERPPARPRRPDRADAADVRRRPRGPCARRGAGGDPGRGARGRAVRAADRRTPTTGSRRAAPSAPRRGSTSARCAASRCSGSTSPARTCRGSHRRRC